MKSPQSAPKRPLWQLLLAPMLLVSLGLHAAVLFTPVAPSEGDLVPPPDPEEDGIGITRVDPPRSRAPQSQSNPGTVKTAATTPPRAAGGTPAAPRGTQAGGARPSGSSGSKSTGSSGGGTSGQSQSTSNQASSGSSGASSQPPSLPEALPGETIQLDPVEPDVSLSDAQLFDEYVRVVKSYNAPEAIAAEQISEEQALWLEILAAENPEYSSLQPEEINNLGEIAYEPQLCLPSEPLPAKVLVLVEADGSVNNEFVQLVQSTGYSDLDTTAEIQVLDYGYPSSDGPKAFLVEMKADYDAADCREPEEASSLSDEYFALLNSYDPALPTNLRDAEAAAEDWLNGLAESGEITPDETAVSSEADSPFPTLEDFDGQVDYAGNFEACLPFAPQAAWWGIVVNPDGTLKEEPELLKSTGYSTFDEDSLQIIQDYSFPVTESTQAYFLEVPVRYRADCKELSSENFPPSPDSSPSTSPSNSPSPSTPSNNPPALGSAISPVVSNVASVHF